MRVLAKPETKSDEKRPQAEILIECAEGMELFHSVDDDAYIRVEINGHRENHRINSKFLSRWLQQQFYGLTSKAPNAEAMRTALKQLEAMAFFDGERHPVHLRIAEHNGNIYVDLCDDDWRAVEITSHGWRIIDEPPVRFVRAKAMLPLPEPKQGGNLLDLRKFIQTKNKHDFVLVISWLLGVFRADGPYPILALYGEQGSAKSTTAELLRGMADPALAPLRTLPRDERDLFITAKNSRVLAFDNVSAISDWLSDALCRLATGGGFSTRELHSNGDEYIISATRPILLTAIEDCIERGDLADRAILVELARINEDNRRAVADIKREFDEARPKMLGSLFTALSHGLRELPNVRLNTLPRMADFAKWAVACELALWRERRFTEPYKLSRANNNETLIDASSVAAAVRDYAKTQHGKVEHTATELLGLLNQLVNPDVKRERAWPKKANALSGKIRRDAPALRAAGIDVEFDSDGRGADRRNIIRITPAPR